MILVHRLCWFHLSPLCAFPVPIPACQSWYCFNILLKGKWELPVLNRAAVAGRSLAVWTAVVATSNNNVLSCYLWCGSRLRIQVSFRSSLCRLCASVARVGCGPGLPLARFCVSIAPFAGRVVGTHLSKGSPSVRRFVIFAWMRTLAWSSWCVRFGLVSIG